MLAVSRQSRPVTLNQLIGQDHVKSVLQAAITQGRIGHAYLFSGPRGVGKTTSARLLAMAVNCDEETGRPCGACESCRLVQTDAHPDVQELDAASHNSVDDIRELREHVGLASLRGGRRVWILDEAHMLSRSAANALLKTLEEPPANTLFILATTEPEKLPPTILSRCQHFRFRRLLDSEIASKIRMLTDQAGKAADDEAIEFIAAAADGAMRDAESLLERLLITEGPITRASVEETLGLPPAERLNRFVTELFGGNLPGLLANANELYWEGFAPRTVAEQLSRALRQALHGALAGEAPYHERLNDVLSVLERADSELERFVRQNDLYALELYLVHLYNHLHLAQATPVTAVEPAAPAADKARIPAPAAKAPPKPVADPAPAAPPPATPAATPTPEPAAPTTPAPAAQGSEENVYSTLLEQVSDGILKAFLAPAAITKHGNTVTVQYKKGFEFHHGKLQEQLEAIEQLAQTVFGAGTELVVGLGDAPPKAPAAGRKAAPAPPQTPPPAPKQAAPRPKPPATPAPAPEVSDEPPLPSDPFEGAPVVGSSSAQPAQHRSPQRAQRQPTSAGERAQPTEPSGGLPESEASAELNEMQSLFPGTVLRYSWERQPEVPGVHQNNESEDSFEEIP